MRKLFLSLLFMLTITVSFSQKTKKDTLKIEEISVEKPYIPTILDATKPNQNPSLNELDSIKKEKINYKIFSVPVASTFTPAKGKVQEILLAPKERYFQNYLSVGYGNYNSPQFETFIHSNYSNYNDFGIIANYRSSDGGIKNVLVKDNFSDLNITAFYKQTNRSFNWQIDGNYQQKTRNYYGLPENVTYSSVFLTQLNPTQTYKIASINGKLENINSVLSSGSAYLSNFSDLFGSNEIQLEAKPQFELPFLSNTLKGKVLFNFISGKFNQNYLNSNNLNHTFLNLGVAPHYEILGNSYTIDLGGKVYYVSDFENKTNKFYAYPNFTFSFQIIEDIFILNAGFTGDLIQNSYKNFVEENPFVSPTLNVLQTDNQYNAFLGLKGKIASNVNYSVTTNYSNEKNKPLFLLNQSKSDGNTPVFKNYEAGNSFRVIYDNLRTFGLNGEITLTASKEFSVSGLLNYTHFTTQYQPKAWNLPTLSATISTDYTTKKWAASAKLFYRNQTTDYYLPYTSSNGNFIINPSYTDLNLSASYFLTNRFTIFAKVNNALGSTYNSFTFYQVQSIQVIGGLSYKFDL